MESLKTFLASRTHFEVLGLGLEGQVLGLGIEASSPQKLPCPRPEDSTIFCTIEILLENIRNLMENLRIPFFVFRNIGDCLKILLLLLLMGSGASESATDR